MVGRGIAGKIAEKVAQTLIELAGLDVAPPEPFHGRSFASLLHGESEAAFHDFVITGAYLRRDLEEPANKWSTPVLYTQAWAYAPIGITGERELFDLQNDPYNETNVADDHPHIVNDLHEALLSWLHGLSAPSEAIAAMG